MTTTAATSATSAAGSAGLWLRPGRADEAELLSEIALRGKAWWGYSPSFLEACRDELTLTPIDAARTGVAVVDGRVAGFHLIGEVERSGARPGVGELHMLFTDPDFTGQGVGRVLLEDARAAAAARGWTHLLVESDPNAVGFYSRLGAVPVGERLSGSIPGCSLPLLEVPTRAAGGGSLGGYRATYWR